jgi:hypothetical protein
MVRRFVLVVSLLGVGAFTALASPAGAVPPDQYTTGQAPAAATEGGSQSQVLIGNQTAPVTLTNSRGNTITFSATVTWPNPFPADGAVDPSSMSTLTIGGNTFELVMDPGSALQGSTLSFSQSFQGLHNMTRIRGTITGLSEAAITAPTSSTASVDISVRVW